VFFCFKFFQRRKLQPIKARIAWTSIVCVISYQIIPVGMLWLELFPGREVCILPSFAIFLGFYTFAGSLIMRMVKLFHTFQLVNGSEKHALSRVDLLQKTGSVRIPNHRKTSSGSNKLSTRSNSSERGFLSQRWSMEKRKYFSNEYLSMGLLIIVVIQAMPGLVHFSSWAAEGNNLFARRANGDECDIMWEKVIFISSVWLAIHLVLITECNRRLRVVKESYGIGRELLIISLMLVYVYVLHEINENVLGNKDGLESVSTNVSSLLIQEIPALFVLFICIIQPYYESFQEKWLDINTKIIQERVLNGKSREGTQDDRIRMSIGDIKDSNISTQSGGAVEQRVAPGDFSARVQEMLLYISTDDGFNKFKDFLSKEFASESLLFWKEAHVYQEKFKEPERDEDDALFKKRQITTATELYMNNWQ
jgi:hypothetical protein